VPWRAGFTAVLVLGAASTARAQTTVTFDNFLGMPNSSGAVVPVASRLNTQLLSAGVRFASLSDFIAVVTLGTGHATSGTRGVGGTTAAGALSYAAPLRVTFWDPADSTIQGVTDFVQLRGDLIPVAGTITMKVFDPAGTLLATVAVPDTAGARLTYTGANVHAVEVTSSSSTVAYDDLQFGAVVPVAPDAGVDAGADAGAAEDAGFDAGTEPDAGAVDAGDAADAGPDGGAPDGGAVLDAGAPADSGAPVDAGEGPDAGSEDGGRDAGTSSKADAGTDTPDEGGCGCTSGGATPMALALAAMLLRRRRAVQRSAAREATTAR
jgi:uncharacterized protein (TIGR03382 family)